MSHAYVKIDIGKLSQLPIFSGSPYLLAKEAGFSIGTAYQVAHSRAGTGEPANERRISRKTADKIRLFMIDRLTILDKLRDELTKEIENLD